ncbi:hypothetical protein [Hymenobacter elongatus]|uniref:Uncharacterized protein n=1 Tax=Hymenobacter elongatus TaxID=877208 RepID=A0A4Z0PHU1_9BACT|nr:hypothetical protein [Hymenobacter elongatus]TGE14325.1 hypothetical protein E5J99_16470 [Hymenobacter elongatus]
MKKLLNIFLLLSLLVAGELLTSCAASAQTVVVRPTRPVYYRPARVVVVEPAPVYVRPRPAYYHRHGARPRYIRVR